MKEAWREFANTVTNMLVTMVVVLLIILAASKLFGQGVYGAEHNYKEQTHKIKHALEYAHISDPDWSILVIPKKDWWEGIPPQQRVNYNIAGTCYTYRPKKLTWCNQDWLKWAETPAIVHTLRHEYGHIWCKNSSEECADMYAKSFTGGGW